MIPVLYKKDERQFRNYGLGPIHDMINPEVRRERHGQYFLYFQYPNNAEFASVFEEEMKIKSDAGVRTKWQTFEISRVKRESDQMIEITAKHISQSLTKDALNPRINVRDSTAEQALRTWNNNRIGDLDFDVWSNISTPNSTSWSIDTISNAMEALGGKAGSILDVWGGEFEFDNQTIRLHQEMGRETPVTLEYGRNITKVEQDKQDDNVYTSIYPYVLHSPQNEEGEVTEQQIITLPERYVDGKYLDMHNRRKLQLVDFTTEFDYDETPTVERLRTLAENYADINEVGTPHENIKVEYVDLSKTLDYQDYQYMEEVELNDRLPLFYPDFNITNQNAKIVAVVYDPVKEENKNVEVGVIGQTLRSALTSNVESQLNRLERQQAEANRYIVNARGNRVWNSTPDENMEHNIGDLWFEENGQYSLLYIWNGNQWIERLNTENIDQNAQAITDAQEDLENYKTDIDGTLDTINADIDDKFTSLTDITDDLQAITDATKVSAETAIDNSLDAISNAQMAIDSVSGLESTVSNIDIEIDEINGTLELKADSQTVDTLSGVVDSHTLDIQANAEALSFKADSSTVDTITGEVNVLSTDIQAMAGELSSKVSSTEMQAAIDGVEVGGRNLLLDSRNIDFVSSTKESHLGKTAITWDAPISARYTNPVEEYSEQFIAGQTYTFSFLATYEGTKGTSLRLYASSSFFSYTEVENFENVEEGKFTRVWVTATPTLEGATTRFHITYNGTGKLYVTDFKVEKGNKATDWTPAPEDTDAKFSHIETEWTQTFDSFTQTVSDLEGNVSSVVQTVDSHTTAISDAEGNISSVEQTVSGLQSTVADKASQSDVTQLSNAVDLRVTSEDFTSAISVLEENIKLKVSEGNVVSQINLEAGRTLIDTNQLLLSANSVVFSGSAFIPNAYISSLSADKLTAGTIDANQIDVINFNVNRLTGNTSSFVQTAWNGIGSSVGIDSSGIHVHGSTEQLQLFNGQVDFINSSGNRTASLTSSYIDNQEEGMGVFLDTGNIFSITERRSNSYNTLFRIRQNAHIYTNLNMDGNEIYNVNRYRIGSGGYLLLGNENTTNQNSTSLITSEFLSFGIGAPTSWSDRVRIGNNMQLFTDITMSGNNVLNANRYGFGSNGYVLESNTGRGSLISSYQVGIGIGSPSSWQSRIVVGGNVRIETNLNMRGNEIQNESDERLKENIISDNSSKLDIFKQLDFVKFDWIEDGKEDFGLIAQQVELIAPELISVDADSDENYLTISSSQLNKYSWRAIQELAYKLEEQKFDIKSDLWNHKTLIDELKEEVTELKEEVNQLKGAA